jgi:hypothetical protein
VDPLEVRDPVEEGLRVPELGLEVLELESEVVEVGEIGGVLVVITDDDDILVVEVVVIDREDELECIRKSVARQNEGNWLTRY